MSVMRCRCNRVVDLDWHLEDWADGLCVWCAEAEEQLTQEAAAADDDHARD